MLGLFFCIFKTEYILILLLVIGQPVEAEPSEDFILISGKYGSFFVRRRVL